MNHSVNESRKCWRCSADLTDGIDQCLSHSIFDFNDDYKSTLLNTNFGHKFVIVLFGLEPGLFYETQHRLAIHYDQEKHSRCLGYFSEPVDLDALLTGKVHLTRDQISPLTPELREWCLQHEIVCD